MAIWLAGNAASVTAAKLLDGDAFQVMLYVVGVPVVALYVKDVVWLLELKHTLVVDGASAMDVPTVTVNEVEELTQPPLVFFTVRLPVYVPKAVPAGTLIMIGLAGNDALVTATKLFNGDPFQVILYTSGEPKVALYANDVV